MMTHQKQYITRKNLRQRYDNISEMTLWRWEHDEKLGFPEAIDINGRKYYDLAAIEAWERRRAARRQSEAPMSTAAPIISVYDGSHLIGHIRERDREHIARTGPDEILIGTYLTRRKAADAISAADRQTRRQKGERA
jgi:hypothetical protein